MDEAESRRIAGLLGPTIIVMIVSEFPLVQPRLYDAQTPPVVYLSCVSRLTTFGDRRVDSGGRD